MNKLTRSLTWSVAIAAGLLSCSKKDPAPSNDIKDIDGNVYHAITIGTQTWMVENLKTTKYRNGEPILSVTDAAEWGKLITGGYCNLNNDEINSTIYGRLYNWSAVTDTRKIAPAGWHVPGEGDWILLRDFLGGQSVAGGKLKEKGITHWIAPNTDATNETGFTGLPGGMRASTGMFTNLTITGNWWSTTATPLTINGVPVDYATGFWLSYSDAIGLRVLFPKGSGFSVRCIKD